MQELRAAAEVLAVMGSEGSGGVALGALRELIAHWQRRLPLMAGAPQALEPVLAVRCGVLRASHA